MLLLMLLLLISFWPGSKREIMIENKSKQLDPFLDRV